MSDRILRDELLNSERYWAVSDEAKLLYIHLIISVDDTARYSGKNFTLRTRCFSGRGMEANRMEILLSELVDQDLIRLYFVGEERFVFIPRFKQRLRYVKSKYPEPPNEINDIVIKKTDQSPTEDGPQTVPSPQKRREEKRREVNPAPNGFDLFWSAYPKKSKKAGALKIWVRLKPDGALQSKILKSVESYKKSEKVTKGYVMEPTTWLNNGCWDDEVGGDAGQPKWRKLPNGTYQQFFMDKYNDMKEHQVPQEVKDLL